MSNFIQNTITEMDYNSISDFATHYLEDVRDDVYVTIYADWRNTEKLISVLSTVATPVSIEYGRPDIVGYDKEYCISIVNVNNEEELFVEYGYNNDRQSYFNNVGEEDVIILIGDMSDEFMQLVKERCKNIVKVSF